LKHFEIRMKRPLRILLIFLAILIALTLLIGLFFFYSVEDRVVIERNQKSFENPEAIERLDSGRIKVDSLNNYLTKLLGKANVQGLGISIINNRNLVYQKYFGRRNVQNNESFNPGCIWYAASFSKTIFADIVLQLSEENIIHLDSPIYKYLPKPLYAYTTSTVQQILGSNFYNYSELEGDDRYKRITARMCLSHTSGLPNWRWIEDDGKLKIKFEPGTRYSYSGEGMFLLQMVIEELTGESFEEMAIKRVFIPLGMDQSSFVWQRDYEDNHAVGHDINSNDLRIQKTNVPNAAGSLSISLEDYTKFFIEILKQGKPRYTQLITPQVRIKSKQQFGPNAWIDTNENDSIQLSYGLGFGLYETPFGKAFFKEGHGDGWQHYAVGFPERGLGLIMMSNSDQAESIFKELIEFTTGNKSTPWFWEGYIPYDK
jgi:serine-type D-Ala-D-Ala carboxypeptidase/endopeptidase